MEFDEFIWVPVPDTLSAPLSLLVSVEFCLPAFSLWPVPFSLFVTSSLVAVELLDLDLSSSNPIDHSPFQ